MDAGEIFFLCCVKFLTTLCCLRGLPVMTMRPNCCLKLQFYRGRWCFCNHLVNCYKSVLVIFCKKKMKIKCISPRRPAHRDEAFELVLIWHPSEQIMSVSFRRPVWCQEHWAVTKTARLKPVWAQQEVPPDLLPGQPQTSCGPDACSSSQPCLRPSPSVRYKATRRAQNDYTYLHPQCNANPGCLI